MCHHVSLFSVLNERERERRRGRGREREREGEREIINYSWIKALLTQCFRTKVAWKKEREKHSALPTFALHAYRLKWQKGNRRPSTSRGRCVSLCASSLQKFPNIPTSYSRIHLQENKSTDSAKLTESQKFGEIIQKWGLTKQWKNTGVTHCTNYGTNYRTVPFKNQQTYKVKTIDIYTHKHRHVVYHALRPVLTSPI